MQAFGCTVLVDASATEVVDGVSVPAVDIVRPSQPVRLVVGWSPASMSESGGYHQALRRAPDTHGTAMRDLAALARRAADAVHGGDVDGLAAALDDGWRVRQAVAPLRDDHAALVDAVRALGVAATTPGSGGAVVAITRSDDDTAAVVDALSAAGCPSAAWLMR